MERENKSMFWSCLLLCIAVVLYSVLRVLPFGQQLHCATSVAFKELKGREYILSTQVAACKDSSFSNVHEMLDHYSARAADC